MKSVSKNVAAALMASFLAAMSGSSVLAQSAEDSSHRDNAPAQPTPYVPLPPHQQPREANAPKENAIGPNAKQKTEDRKIDKICRDC